MCVCLFVCVCSFVQNCEWFANGPVVFFIDIYIVRDSLSVFFCWSVFVCVCPMFCALCLIFQAIMFNSKFKVILARNYNDHFVIIGLSN